MEKPRSGLWEIDVALQFLRDLTGPIAQWAERIRSNRPVAIVTLGRKGTRALEILEKFILPDKLPVENMTTNLALPFEQLTDWRGKTVAVVDDIVIWGTAMREQEAEFQSLGIHPLLFCIALDKHHAGWVFPDHVMQVEGSKTTSFCAAVVRAIGLLNKPYMLEYPVIKFGFNFSKNHFSFMALPDGARLYELTFPSQEEHGLIRATVDEVPDFHPHELFHPSLTPVSSTIRKIRLYGSIKDKSLSLVPMITFQWPSNLVDACRTGKVFAWEFSFFNDLLKEAANILALKHDKGTLNPTMPLARLCAYFASYIMGIRMAPRLISGMSCGSLVGQSSGVVSLSDVQLVFGRYVANRIIQELEMHRLDVLGNSRKTSSAASRMPKQQILFPMGGVSQEILTSGECLEVGMTDRWLDFEQECGKKIAPEEEPARCVLAILKAMRDVYDLQTRNPDQYAPDRLKVGITFAGLMSILNKYGKRVTDSELSASIDFLIDAGAMVPRYLPGPSGTVSRVYRFGEDIFSLTKAPYVVRHVLEYSLRRLNHESISYFRFDKTLAFLKCTMDCPWRRGDVFLYWDRFGARVEFLTPGQRSSLADYCSKEKIARFESSDSGSSRRVSLNTEFESLHPKTDCPLDGDREVASLENQIELFWALVGEESDNRILLAITTCFDAQATTSALIAEVDDWLADKSLGIQNVITLWIRLVSLAR